MWKRIAAFILKFRLYIIITLAAITAFMGLMATRAELSYDLMKIVPPDNPDMVYFNKFIETFGEDANMFAIGMRDSAVYSLENFKALAELERQIRREQGIIEVVSLPGMFYLDKNREERRFEATKLFQPFPETQAELDSLLQKARDIKFYEGRLINPNNGATVILVSMDVAYLNSAKRMGVIDDIQKAGDAFTQDTGIDLHYAGLPYVRATVQTKVKQELNLFLGLSIVVTAIILFVFFRSFSPVLFSLMVIGMVVIWTVGTLGILEFKITMLTGLLPPILVVIGIPNCIYLLNKYHQEYVISNDKQQALSKIIRKIGIVTLITNSTTAIGFFVLAITDIQVLKEFGIVATINIFGTFLISITFIPSVFSYRPAPETRHIRHLSFSPVQRSLDWFDTLVENHRLSVYIITAIVSIVAFYGMQQVKVVAFMVDDLPENSQIVQDLKFFEKNFNGIMPLEIVVDTGRKKGFRKRENIQKIAELEDSLANIEELTPPVSLITFYKTANQAYFNNNPYDYRLPKRRDEPYVQRYISNQDSGMMDLSSSFIDTSGQVLRVSMKVADLGSIKMKDLMDNKILPAIDSVFKGTDMEGNVKVTGTTLLFIKGNDFLVENLRTSMLIAFGLIAIIMGSLFKNLRMIVISIVPNVVPLMITAGLMGFLGIPLKPSTALVFSIVFGISVDDSIHFLAKYRQELIAHHFNVPKAIKVSLKETGTSMVYTSIVLFCGFVIFVASDFGGTVSLGALTSTTLLIAMITNLILLPCLLRSFDITGEKMRLQAVFEPLDTFYHEDEDEAIDVHKIELKNTDKGRDGGNA